ncbi:TVP38/TMEM64 family protein [Kitasatospora gansuensis]
MVRSPWFRLGALLAVLAAAAGSLLLWSPTELLRDGVPIPVFLLVYAVATLAFVPKPALNGAAGAVLGTAQGVPVAVAATTLGALLGFWLGRALGRDAVRPLLRGKLAAALDRRLSEHGFRSMLLVRVVPGCRSRPRTTPPPSPRSGSCRTPSPPRWASHRARPRT